VPALVGLTGDALADPVRFTSGFQAAMLLAAATVGLGGVLAFATIRDELPDGRPACRPLLLQRRRQCPVDGAAIEPAPPRR
jgi:hypothetical protein